MRRLQKGGSAMDRILEYTVLSADEGKSLGEILRSKLQLTTRQIRSIKFSETGLLLNGEKHWVDQGGRARYVTTGTPVKTGDRVTAFFREDEPSVVKAEGDLDVLYEDTDLIVINKPADLVCHPAHGHFTDTLINRLAARYQEPARLIGRLDKETSGAIIAARNAIAANHFKEQREQGELSREYLALVEGQVEGSGICDFPLLRVKSKEKTGKNGQPLSLMLPPHLVKNEKAIPEEGQEPLNAVTEWEVMKTGIFQEKPVTLIRLHLQTGRTHQIRTHMAALGYPLLGDGLYGSGPDEQTPRTMLHSVCLRFIHPFTKEEFHVEAPLPQDFEEIIRSTTWH